MITNNHIEYLKSTLEPEEGYPYQELYEWSNKFIQAHYMSLVYSDSKKCIPKDIISLIESYPWKNRYNCLVQHGTFYENIIKLEDIRWNENDEDKWRVALDLKNIPYEMANFEVCYCWMSPGRYCWMSPERFFCTDWRKFEEDVHSMPSFQSDVEANAWHFVDSMYKKISREHLPICTVEEFMETKI